MLKISPELALPTDAVTQTFAILAIKRAGKSNAAVVMAEEMYDNGIPWVAIDRLSPVVGLLFRGRPTTVARSVWPVVVDAVDRVLSLGTWTHVFQKLREVIQPFRGNRDASTPVPGEVWRLRVEAPILHPLPCVIFDGLAETVSPVSERRAFSLEAPAGLDLASDQMVLLHRLQGAAVASAYPCSVLDVRSRTFLQHKQTTESSVS